MPKKRPQSILQLRRYAGSRLYDPERKTYVSAEDLDRFRAEGHRISVRDVETGQDVTDACMGRPIH
ncbi:polyhydroxyalkanoate synthesis regulator DNA-binding domain-containing protein [Methylobacterium sp. E-025]|uniref:polyhydroxyalkanoate synthesis regulator DNA-binding domain-containing protein n=1 Tax=unclassified Methylobacterium TaxID=2615210 RepID=UPI001FBA6DD0|nr:MULTISPECIES: polyhydroxyalkanoate synthesis regulator DNA-binding domain-containing protein [unclassified Methylobacterium]MCJ2040865.1 polyhydroxyalkanoate synthesis regulator DNA-binding domain-containing protein [Methylobacterium sp. J-059]MCJ2114198.1 polyhydroxyalkanoate synthesis regulator DNA-binding domain-containing protein [Methylobacterium sp. E-025]